MRLEIDEKKFPEESRVVSPSLLRKEVEIHQKWLSRLGSGK